MREQAIAEIQKGDYMQTEMISSNHERIRSQAEGERVSKRRKVETKTNEKARENMKVGDHKPQTNEKLREDKPTEHRESTIPHERYLKQCFREQINLPIDEPQRIDIYSFKNKRVAKGYQRVVTTYQGMYYELTWQQLEWDNLQDRGVTIGGDYRWGTEGLTVYQPIKEMPTSCLVRHRFAILPKTGCIRKRLRTDRYYIHVYQTKIGKERKTPRSKKIAKIFRGNTDAIITQER